MITDQIKFVLLLVLINTHLVLLLVLNIYLVLLLVLNTHLVLLLVLNIRLVLLLVLTLTWFYSRFLITWCCSRMFTCIWIYFKYSQLSNSTSWFCWFSATFTWFTVSTLQFCRFLSKRHGRVSRDQHFFKKQWPHFVRPIFFTNFHLAFKISLAASRYYSTYLQGCNKPYLLWLSCYSTFKY